MLQLSLRAIKTIVVSSWISFSLASPLLKQEQPIRQAIISRSLHWNMSLSFSKGCDQNYHSYVLTLVILLRKICCSVLGVNVEIVATSPGPAGGTPGVWPASPTLGGIWSRPSPPCRARSVSRSCPPGPRPPPHPPPPTAPASSSANWIPNPTYRFSLETQTRFFRVDESCHIAC